jgi:hypothetical protein
MTRSARVLLVHRPSPSDYQDLVATLVPEGETWEHRFEPVGTSVARVGPEASVVVHTWPERGVATLDGYGAASVDLRSRLRALGWRILE